jgi:hypothetical protein
MRESQWIAIAGQMGKEIEIIIQGRNRGKTAK